MIIGNGMMAKAFELYKNRDDICVFASGVSFSRETNDSVFCREIDLLNSVIKNYGDKKIIYFSTCSIEDPVLLGNQYIAHKRQIESLLEEYQRTSGLQYYIFRLPQVVGNTKNETIISFFKKKIMQGETISIWAKSTRNLIDVDDVFKIVDYCITRKLFENSVVNIATPFYLSPLQIVLYLEKIMNKKALYKIIDEGASYHIDISKITPHIISSGVFFDKEYPFRVLQKYQKDTLVLF